MIGSRKILVILAYSIIPVVVSGCDFDKSTDRKSVGHSEPALDRVENIDEVGEEEFGIAIWPIEAELLDGFVGDSRENVEQMLGSNGIESKFLEKTRLTYNASFEQMNTADKGDLIGFSLYFDEQGKIAKWTGVYRGGTYHNK